MSTPEETARFNGLIETFKASTAALERDFAVGQRALLDRALKAEEAAADLLSMAMAWATHYAQCGTYGDYSKMPDKIHPAHKEILDRATRQGNNTPRRKQHRDLTAQKPPKNPDDPHPHTRAIKWILDEEKPASEPQK